MLASRILPPPVRPSPPTPPIATFFSIPRRYVKLNTKVGASQSNMENAKQTRSLQKTSRANDALSSSTSSPVGTKEEQLNSFTPCPRITRKRAASIEEEMNGREPQGNSPVDSRAVQGASSTGSGELSRHVCLCHPELKIPRPRNAFILYRQHHQHAIVARNPGLANPEISKIIGEQWKAESEAQKKIWRDLAVARHQEQYPDYRYQPRRFGRTSSTTLNPAGQHTTIDKFWCPKCGGRSIKTPTSPYLSSTASTPTLPPPNISENHTPTTKYLPMMNSLSLESPAHHRRIPSLSSLNHIQTVTASQDQAIYSPPTPDGKRRRYNHAPTSNSHRDGEYYGHIRRDSLPPIALFRQSTPNSATMPPPRTARRASVGLNVLVPNTDDQSRSVEAMVMSVPFPVKIKVLGRITPPLKDPGPTSPAIQVRGAIIAIEGEDTIAVYELSEWLKDFLAKDKEYSPRLGEPPKGPEDKGEVTFEDYLGLIKEWHGKSKDMVKYITTPISESDDEGQKQKNKSENHIKPVVILPTYQLRASDVYTSCIPIQDAYSPTDHWQWIATLWRGTVGPDLTIYIHSYDPKDGLGTAKLVDLNEEVRCMTVRKEKGSKFDAGALRRVGFEVSEWIQGIGEKSA
ncbi:hypothetical protein CC78DRAFT_15934 [Lojkania enalia]|uniref:HMG box domain-containing protein n=1 Tax=Lojkania enalia TaxID=147567 RepID=A0A9P4KFG6_9PLEO|nr:hypothetical protein CC78DRAFT_15934 [Didymosphaeria enalia]